MSRTIEEVFEAQRMFYQLEDIFEWRSRWVKEIPFINFPAEWSVKVIPPFAAAIVRFLVCKKGKESTPNSISVYLDGYETLGCMDEPYWEIYPGDDGDTERCRMNSIDDLLDAIGRALNALEKEGAKCLQDG